MIRLIQGKNRVIFVAKKSIDLSSTEGENCVYVLQLPLTAGVAGGRVGGFGERRMERVHCFRQENGKWVKVMESADMGKLSLFELPYHASGLSIVLPDGTQTVVSGVVDEALVEQYGQVAD